MNPAIQDWQGVIHRLEKLERENRRLKGLGLAVSLVASAVLLMGQAAPQKTVEANQFILIDTNGNPRATLDIFAGRPGLVLYDSAGKTRASLNVNDNGEPGLILYDASGKVRASLAAIADGPFLSLDDSGGKTRALLAADSIGPRLAISDQEGFQTKIGTAELVTPRTGETHKTSAASVLLFDNDQNVIWKAP